LVSKFCVAEIPLAGTANDVVVLLVEAFFRLGQPLHLNSNAYAGLGK
jgi:hypothetical protein